MSMFQLTTRRAVAALSVAFVLAGCASGPGSPSPELLQRIESAKTRGDHEALAMYYEKEAKSARAMADEHRKMSRAYQGTPYGVRGGASMPAHCNANIRNFEAAAAEYEALAKGHREVAATVQP
ncbi:MAG: hypothetical protein JNN03_23705 [Rubrivivax sp.]|nr:hypothetical protein [Rubrivivax sp.]